MTDQFPFLGDKIKATFAAMSLSVLLLLPASLGLSESIVEEVFGQLELLPDEEEEATTTTLSPSASTFLLRGLIASSLPDQGGDITTEDSSSSYIVAGRFRIFVDQGLVSRFVAEMNIAATNGTAFHNITIEETTPHRFELTEIGNGTSTTTAAGSIPPVSSNLMARIFVNSNTPAIDNVPLTISIRSQILAIEGIDIDETVITDPAQRDILSIIDGQSIYGIVSR
jgi:hypothetical protein